MTQHLEGNVHFAVVGCGHIAKPHAEMVVQNPEATLVAMADVQSPEKPEGEP